MTSDESDRRHAHPAPAGFTDKHGQHLALIATYTLVNGRPPAEAGMQCFFGVTPPSVHQMVLTLKKAGPISRAPRAASSSSSNPDAIQSYALD